VGLAALIGSGAHVLILMGRPDDVVTAGSATAVVLVVAGLSPHHTWVQSLLRLVDTVVGITVGLAGAWMGALLVPRQPAPL
jgi:hypothetical protein